MYVFRPGPDQTDRNTLQIEKRFLLLALQTARDRTDGAYTFPRADWPARGASVALPSVTTTNQNEHICFVPPREDRDGSRHSRRRKCDALPIDVALVRIFPELLTSNRSPRDKP